MRPTHRPQYGPVHQAASKALIAEHVAAYGWWCPGLEGVEEAHPSTDLVADHVVAGQPEHGYAIVCRVLNSKRRSLGLG